MGDQLLNPYLLISRPGPVAVLRPSELQQCLQEFPRVLW